MRKPGEKRARRLSSGFQRLHFTFQFGDPKGAKPLPGGVADRNTPEDDSGFAKKLARPGEIPAPAILIAERLEEMTIGGLDIGIVQVSRAEPALRVQVG